MWRIRIMVEEMKRAWTDNKLVMSICGVVIAGLMAWGIWLTKIGFASQFNEVVLSSVCNDVEAMKKIDAGLKLQAEVLAVKFEVQTLKMETNQKEMLQNQAEIMKALKRR
jgi:hypothetical protein